jgi:hypothetical protein
MNQTWKIVLVVIITAVLVGGGMYYFNGVTKMSTTETKTFMEYYTERDQFLNNSMSKAPAELGLKEIVKVEIACPEDADGPCGGFLEIVSASILGSGNQEFYLAEEGGAGYSYYGPFTDDLQRIVSESQAIKSLK